MFNEIVCLSLVWVLNSFNIIHVPPLGKRFATCFLPAVFSCGFEDDLCGMTGDVQSTFGWKRHWGSTFDLDTGPVSGEGHTNYFVYLDSSTGGLNQVARYETLS